MHPQSAIGEEERRKFIMNFHHWLLVLLLCCSNQISLSSGKSDGMCVSKGGRFPPYESQGKPPRKVSRGSKDLNFCRVFRKKTCCSVAQTHPALLAVRKLASTGEASQECLDLFELLECSICDPNVGVQPGLPCIFTSFCDRVFEACSPAYFSMDAKTRVLQPCGTNDFVCGRASEWVSNGTEFCRAVGFVVETSDTKTAEEKTCYGNKASLDSITESWRTSKSDPSVTLIAENFALEDFQQWVRELTLNEKIYLVGGGLISLTGGLFFLSKRKSRHQRQKLANIQRSARRLGGNMNHSRLI